ncbi:hypothetical protein [Metapseudomonas otitidis]|uniref:hypothetical protein n=1 Tax=Metapseudomonas otitidis TaxID=319939 RepID=UPI0020978EE1|nr:hypothetical protein [Pseudomonas otitidis]MCO7556428.1 hypothetical protein [Pseudomonas otitidis]
MSELKVLSKDLLVFGGKKNISEKVVTPAYYVIAQTFSADEDSVYAAILYERTSSFVSALDASTGAMKWVVEDQSDGSRWVYLARHILAGPLLIDKSSGIVCFDLRTIPEFDEPSWPYAIEVEGNRVLIELSESDSSGLYISLSLVDFTYEILDLGIQFARHHDGKIYGWKIADDISKFYRLGDAGGLPEFICSIQEPIDYLVPKFTGNFAVYENRDSTFFSCIDLASSSCKRVPYPTEGGAVTAYSGTLFIVRRGLWKLNINEGSVSGPFLPEIVEWYLSFDDGKFYSVEQRGQVEEKYYVCMRNVEDLELLWERELALPGNGVFLGGQGIYVEPMGNSGGIQFFKYSA